MIDIAGATVNRGILGYGAKGHEHKQSFFHISRDMPIMLSVIDTAEKIAAASQVIEGMLEDGLIVSPQSNGGSGIRRIAGRARPPLNCWIQVCSPLPPFERSILAGYC